MSIQGYNKILKIAPIFFKDNYDKTKYKYSVEWFDDGVYVLYIFTKLGEYREHFDNHYLINWLRRKKIKNLKI